MICYNNYPKKELITMLENLLNDEPILIKATGEDDKLELLYLTKSCFNDNKVYTLSLFEEKDSETKLIGCISFYVDFDDFTSVVSNIKACANYDAATTITYLLASWLNLCEGESIERLSIDINSYQEYATILNEFGFIPNRPLYTSKNPHNSYTRARRIIDDI